MKVDSVEAIPKKHGSDYDVWRVTFIDGGAAHVKLFGYGGTRKLCSKPGDLGNFKRALLKFVVEAMRNIWRQAC